MVARAAVSSADNPSCAATTPGSARNSRRNAASDRSSARTRSNLSGMGLFPFGRAAAPTQRQGVARTVQFAQENRHGRIGTVPLQDDGQRLDGARRDLGQQRIDRLGDRVEGGSDEVLGASIGTEADV